MTGHQTLFNETNYLDYSTKTDFCSSSLINETMKPELSYYSEYYLK